MLHNFNTTVRNAVLPEVLLNALISGAIAYNTTTKKSIVEAGTMSFLNPY